MSGGKLIVSETSQRRRRILPTTAIYLVAVTAVLAFNLVRSRAARDTVVASEQTPANVDTRPFFSLSTNRTFSPNEAARLWTSYQAVDYLDFRVYGVKDPSTFFKQLDDPHH